MTATRIKMLNANHPLVLERSADQNYPMDQQRSGPAASSSEIRNVSLRLRAALNSFADSRSLVPVGMS